MDMSEERIKKSLRLKYKNPLFYHLHYGTAKYTSVLMLNPFEIAMILRQTQFLPTQSDQIIVDSSGYLLPNRNTKPDNQLPNLQNYSIFQTIYSLSVMKHEGFLSIFKGHSCNFLYQILSEIIENSINNLLTDLSFIKRDFSLINSNNVNSRFTILIASHFLTGMILNPLELIQTRLVVQSRKRGVKKYRNPWHCFRTIVEEEYDSIFDIYTTSTLLLPSMIYHLLSPLFRFSTPFLVDKLYGYHSDTSMFVMVELGVSLLELLVMLPVETIRRRLMAQVIRRKPVEREFVTVVDLDPIPYNSIEDCAIRIMTLENHTKSKWSITGLYRGFRIRFMTNLVVALLQLMTRLDSGVL